MITLGLGPLSIERNQFSNTPEPDPGPLAFMTQQNGWDARNITIAQKEEVREITWATLFILHADVNRYGNLITNLQNEYLSNTNKYPKNLNEAYSRLTNWKETAVGNRNSNSEGVSFTNVGATVKKNKDHITCFNCQQKGHYSNECSKPRGGNNATLTTSDVVISDVDSGACDDTDDMHLNSSFQFICDGTTFNTHLTHQIPPTWILLDNQSTIDVFCNKYLLVNVHKNKDRKSTRLNSSH